MSPPLLPEILDLIFDNLRTEPTTLRACCLVSKSWVPSIRRLLFASVRFNSKCIVKSWEELFPDPSTSPACHARVLDIYGCSAITAVNTSARAWINSFCHVIELRLDLKWQWRSDSGRVSLTKLHGFSPALKSLHLSDGPLLEIFDLICSFPLLEDLSLHHSGSKNEIDRWNPPPTSPKLTGTLSLGVDNTYLANGLLRLPSGLHFSGITLHHRPEDTKSTMELISKCSGTLESLSMQTPLIHGFAIPVPLDLSKYPKLKEVVFGVKCVAYEWTERAAIKWVTMTLRATKPKTLRRITIYSDETRNPSTQTLQDWRNLDRLLVTSWASHLIHASIKCNNQLMSRTQSLLPELTHKWVVCERTRDIQGDHPDGFVAVVEKCTCRNLP